MFADDEVGGCEKGPYIRREEEEPFAILAQTGDPCYLASKQGMISSLRYFPEISRKFSWNRVSTEPLRIDYASMIRTEVGVLR